MTQLCALDAMDDAAEQAFCAWPERLYVLSDTLHVLYKGAPRMRWSRLH